MKRPKRKGSGRRAGQRFDAKHGVVTQALLFLGELDPDVIGDALADATHYEPTPPGDLQTVLREIPSPQESTFVDLGCGMGRAVLLASLLPFKQVVGVDASSALCEVARDNAVRWRRNVPELGCSDIRIVCVDALRYAFPRGPLAVYLYNPFGEASVARLADRLSALPQPLSLIYHTPVHRAVFDERIEFEIQRDLGFARVYRKAGV